MHRETQMHSDVWVDWILVNQQSFNLHHQKLNNFVPQRTDNFTPEYMNEKW